MKTTILISLIAMLLVPSTGWARWLVGRTNAKSYQSTQARRYVVKRTGKTRAGDLNRWKLGRALRRLFNKNKGPSAARLAGTLRRGHSTFLWYQRGRTTKRTQRAFKQRSSWFGRTRARIAQRIHQYRARRLLRRQSQGARMGLYRQSGVRSRIQIRRFERLHSRWARQYGLNVANKKLVLALQRLQEEMRQKLRDTASRSSRRLRRDAAYRPSPRRRAWTGRLLSRLRHREGRRLRIFTRPAGQRRGLRGLWHAGLGALRRWRSRAPRPRPRPTTGGSLVRQPLAQP